MPPKTRTLTIYLIKPEIANAIRPSANSRELAVTVRRHRFGTLFVQPSQTQAPGWISFFSGTVRNLNDIAFSSPTSGRVACQSRRQSTSLLDLERPALVHKTEALPQVAKSHLIPDLHGVDVYALGVDPSGKSFNYWQTLRDFWMGYFALAGATVESYSILRGGSEV